MDHREWGRSLAERFPPRDPAEAESAWADLKRRWPVGQPVRGVVVARAPFGAWVDLHVGFPALLEIVVMRDLAPERYRADDWCPIGSDVEATVSSFRDGAHQIYLRQVPFEREPG